MSSALRHMTASSLSTGYVMRFLATCLLLGALLYLIDFRAAFGHARSANWWLLGFSVAILLCRTPFMVRRWQAILTWFGSGLACRRGVYVVLVAAFFGQFSPSGIGNDLSRGFLLAGNRDPATIVASLVADRFFGVFSTVLLAVLPALVVILAGGAFVPTALAWVALALLAGLVTFLASARRLVTEDQQQAASRSQAARFFNMSRASIRMFLSAVSNLRLCVVCVGWSFAIQTMAVASAVMIGLAIGVDMPLWTYFLFIPMVWLAASVPISLGGVGIREVSFVALLPAFGVGPAESLAFGILVSAVSVICAVVGGLLARLVRPLLIPEGE